MFHLQKEGTLHTKHEDNWIGIVSAVLAGIS